MCPYELRDCLLNQHRTLFNRLVPRQRTITSRRGSKRRAIPLVRLVEQNLAAGCAAGRRRETGRAPASAGRRYGQRQSAADSGQQLRSAGASAAATGRRSARAVASRSLAIHPQLSRFYDARPGHVGVPGRSSAGDVSSRRVVQEFCTGAIGRETSRRGRQSGHRQRRREKRCAAGAGRIDSRTARGIDSLRSIRRGGAV